MSKIDFSQKLTKIRFLIFLSKLKPTNLWAKLGLTYFWSKLIFPYSLFMSFYTLLNSSCYFSMIFPQYFWRMSFLLSRISSKSFRSGRSYFTLNSEFPILATFSQISQLFADPLMLVNFKRDSDRLFFYFCAYNLLKIL